MRGGGRGEAQACSGQPRPLQGPSELSPAGTFCTSCLHLSTLSCSFFCCSGVTDCSVLLFISRVTASFSSLQARW